MLTRLTTIQSREGLTDTDMAFRLGLSRSHWNLIKNGRRALTHAVAVRAAGEWPELTRDLLDMAASVSTPANTAPEAA